MADFLAELVVEGIALCFEFFSSDNSASPGTSCVTNAPRLDPREEQDRLDRLERCHEILRRGTV